MISHQQSRPLDHDEAAELINDIAVAKAKFREISEILKAAELEAVDSVGEVVIGDKRYYVGTKTITRQTGETDEICGLIAETGHPIGECLVKQPFKPATVREIIGNDDWGQMFEVETQDDVKTGKPKREVRGADRKFTKAITITARKDQDHDHQ